MGDVCVEHLAGQCGGLSVPSRKESSRRVAVDQEFWILEISMMSNRGWSTVLVGLALLAAAGCSGSKVTTKASAELPRYQIRTIALVPFTTLATPQMKDVVDQSFSAPEGARRSDITIAVPPDTEQHLRQTATVPPGAGKSSRSYCGAG